MVTFGIVSYLIYRADDTLKASKIAFVSYISLLSLIILIFKGYIYSSNTLLTDPKIYDCISLESRHSYLQYLCYL